MQSVSQSESADERDEGAEILANVAAVFNNAGEDNIVVRVVQVDEKGTADLFDVEPDSVLDIFDRVRREFGTGKYQVVTFKNGRFAGRHTFRVKVPANWRAPRPAEETRPSVDPGFAAILQRMDERAERNERLVMGLLERLAHSQPVQPAPDPFALTERVLSLVTTITQATGASKGDGALDLILKGVELRDKLAGEGEGGDSIVGMIREVLPTGLEILGKVATARTAPTAQTTAVLASPPQPVPAANPLLELLLASAAANGDPEIYAGMIEEKTPEAMLEQILAQPDPVAAFAQATAEPRILQHRVWFQEVVDFLREPGDDELAMPAEGVKPGADGIRASAKPNGVARPSAASAAGRGGPRNRNPRNPEADAKGGSRR
jgi:hypothetical protein